MCVLCADTVPFSIGNSASMLMVLRGSWIDVCFISGSECAQNLPLSPVDLTRSSHWHSQIDQLLLPYSSGLGHDSVCLFIWRFYVTLYPVSLLPWPCLPAWDAVNLSPEKRSRCGWPLALVHVLMMPRKTQILFCSVFFSIWGFLSLGW